MNGIGRRRILQLVTIAAAVAVVAAGCKPTTEGERKRFESHKAKVAEYSSTWPGFKTVLDSSLKTATDMMEKAKKVGHEHLGF